MSKSPKSDGLRTNSDISAELSDSTSADLQSPSTSDDGRRFRSRRFLAPSPRTEHLRHSGMDERAPLLSYPDGFTTVESTNQTSRSVRPSLLARRRSTYVSAGDARRKSSVPSFLPVSAFRRLSESFPRIPFQNESGRLWYDQFTSVDWIHDSVVDAERSEAINARRDFRGKCIAWFDAAQGWLISAIIGFIVASIAYLIVVGETAVFDLKSGYCVRGLFITKSKCCDAEGLAQCDQWISWGRALGTADNRGVDFIVYVVLMVAMASLSCLLTLTTRLVAPSTALLHPNKTAEPSDREADHDGAPFNPHFHPPKVMYSAAGSGVAEVRVILSGFILHGFLGLKTLVVKTLALILSVGSGLSVGKEGPLVHIASCVGNVIGRLFPKYATNESKLRELLSAAAASGIAVAFGAPISGVLFSLEDVSYYFRKQTMFRTYFCSLTAALSLRLFNPYSNGQIVLFEVHYEKQWSYLGLLVFMILGALGGAMGALFVKASRIWARTFRRTSFIKNSPLTEVILISVISGSVCFWNHYSSLPVAELLLELASPCTSKRERSTGLCPQTKDEIPGVIGHLAVALVIKAVLTTITFPAKIPLGVYIPSMVVGGLFGRTIGHCLQFLSVTYPNASVFSTCSAVDGDIEGCAVPGTYALLAAGATMCGVTRLTVTLAVILFELTGSLNYVLPFSVSIMVAKWTADAIEPLSIYDLLTKTNSYPFLEHKSRPHLTGNLGDITASLSPERVVDISRTALVPSRVLRSKLNYLQSHGELDGGLSIVEDNILVGTIPCPDLEFALDQIDGGDDGLRPCLLASEGSQADYGNANLGLTRELTDLRPFVDRAPFALDAHAPMELVYECFAKLGLRYICVLHHGHYAGMLHKKAFVQHLEEQAP